MSTLKSPEQEKIDKLPVWAQQYIHKLELAQHAAVRTLNLFQDKQTETNVYYDENPCTGEKSGPTTKRCYVQSGRIVFKLKKFRHQADDCVEVFLDEEKGVLRIGTYSHLLVVEPAGSNCVNIYSRLWDHHQK